MINPIASDVIFPINGVFPKMKTKISKKIKKYIQMLEIIFNPFPIPETQDKMNIVDTNAAIKIHTIGDCTIPKTVSSPAPICISPTPIEFAVAPIRQKITRQVISVFSQGIFLFVTHSTIEEIDKLFPLLKHKTANAAPQTAYIAYWIKLQSHIACATAKIPAVLVCA